MDACVCISALKNIGGGALTNHRSPHAIRRFLLQEMLTSVKPRGCEESKVKVNATLIQTSRGLSLKFSVSNIHFMSTSNSPRAEMVAHTHTHIHTHTHTRIYTYTQTGIYIHICLYTSYTMCVCIYVYTYVYTHVYTCNIYICVHALMSTHGYLCMCVCYICKIGWTWTWICTQRSVTVSRFG